MEKGEQRERKGDTAREKPKEWVECNVPHKIPQCALRAIVGKKENYKSGEYKICHNTIQPSYMYNSNLCVHTTNNKREDRDTSSVASRLCSVIQSPSCFRD